MLSDIEIAQNAKMLKIKDIAKELGIDEEELIPYGHYKAKISQECIDRLESKEDGKLILVTAINPTPAGEGKTTTSVGLAEGMSAYGGHKSSLHRGYARNHFRKQSALRTYR